MNREIKFRAWDGSEMIKDYCYLGKYNHFYAEDLINNGYGNIEAVMQFTGLHDKNGKEIYEGDILKQEEYDEAGIDCGNIFVVEWFRDDIFNGWNIARSDVWSAKIIGNVFENPEIVK